MCTLSWLPGPNGYWVLFSRDERRTRAPGRPPALSRVGSVRILAPADGDFGGTWIGTNHFGVTAALLNRYDDTPIDPTAGSVSRGILLHSVLDAPSATALVARLHDRPLTPFKPFTVATADLRGTLHLADWDGAGLTPSVAAGPGLIRTSSGRDQLQAEAIRGALFERLRSEAGRVSIESLRAFHRSHGPARGPFSVCMHREEAATQSLTEIRVGRHRAVVEYWGGPPCEAPPRRRRSLSLAR